MQFTVGMQGRCDKALCGIPHLLLRPVWIPLPLQAQPPVPLPLATAPSSRAGWVLKPPAMLLVLSVSGWQWMPPTLHLVLTAAGLQCTPAG